MAVILLMTRQRGFLAFALALAFLSEARAIDSGETIQATLAATGEIDSYTLTAATGDTVQIRMTSPDGSDVWPALELRAPNGALLKSSSSVPGMSAEITQTLTSSGLHTIICKGGTVDTGVYHVSMLRLTGYPLNASDPDIGAITSGVTLIGRLNLPGDLDAATFSGVAGDTIQIRMTSPDGSEVWPDVELRAPNGALLKSSSSVPGMSAEVTQTLTSSGIHTIICKGGTVDTGVYHVSMLRLSGYPLAASDSDVGPIANGQTLTGYLNLAGDLDAATFAAVSGDTVQIRMTSPAGSAVWPTMELHAPNGSLLKNSSAVPGMSTEITQTLTANGIYTIICKGGTIDTGIYTVSMSLFGGHTSADIDGDGMANDAELLAGTNPFDPTSNFHISATIKGITGGPSLTWQTVGGQRYRIQYADYLGQPFTDLVRPSADEIESDVPAGQTDWQSFKDDFSSPQGASVSGHRIYRIRIIK